MKTTSLHRNPNYRLNLQGLRAVAIILVVFAHANLTIVPGGYIGVDVFFVLSGYLITGILLSELRQKKRINFLRFYGRRLKRLLPALIFMLVFTTGIAIYLLSGVEARSQLASAPFAATWTSNFYFAFSTLDYFDELAQKDLLLHTWSLGVEEQFYLLWPLFMWGLFKLQKSYKKSISTKRLFLTGFTTAFVLSLIFCILWTIKIPEIAFYMVPSRIWQLSLGAMINFVKISDRDEDRESDFNKNIAKARFLSFSGLAFIIASAIFFSTNLSYPGYWALVPSLGAALIIIADRVHCKDEHTLLSHPFLVWVGDRSYSLYLWHWPIFTIGFSMGFEGTVLPTFSLMLLSFLAAIISYRFVEVPFWKERFSKFSTIKVLRFSILIIVLVSLGLYKSLQQLPSLDSTDSISNQWRFDVPDIYRMQCDAWYNHARVEPCVFGQERADKSVVLLGDSVGAQWFSMVPEIFKEPEWRTIVLTKSSCPIVDEDFYYERIGKIYSVCTDWRNAVIEGLGEIRPDVIILGSSAGGDPNFNEEQWIEGSSRIFEKLSQIAKAVIVIPGTPTLGFDGPGCIERNISKEGRISPFACLAKNRMEHVESVTNYLAKAASRYANVYILNLNDLICPRGDCNAISSKGVIVFRDSQHLTDSFVRAQIPVIKGRLKKLNVIDN